MPIKALIACDVKHRIEEIQAFLRRQLGLEDDEILIARSLKEFRGLYLDHFETLRLIFVDRNLPSDQTSSDTVIYFLDQLGRSTWTDIGLIIGCTYNDYSILPHISIYFGHDMFQSLTFVCRNRLSR